MRGLLMRVPLKHIYLTVIVVALIVMSFAGMAFSAGLGAVISHIFKFDATWLILVVGAQSIAYWAYVIPYKHVFKISYKNAVGHSFGGFHPLLAKGGFSYDTLAHSLPANKSRAYYLGLWEYAALAPVVLIAATYGYINGSVPTALSLPWIIGVPVGTALFAIGIIFRDRVSKFPKAHRLLGFMLDMLKQQNLKELVTLVLGMLLYWAGEIFALWGALQLFDLHLSWFALLIAYATGYVVSRRSLPLGGAGLIIVSLALSLHWVGAALSVALLSALAYQLSNLVMAVIYRRVTFKTVLSS